MVAPSRSGHGEFWRLRLLGGLMLVALLLWYVGSRLDRVLFRLGVQTAEAVYGTVETRYEGRGVILRSETVVFAPASGRVTLLVGEGRHVRAGDLVIEVSDAGELGRAARALEEINRSLATLESSYSVRRGGVLRSKEEAERRLASEERALGEALARADKKAADEAAARRDALRVELQSLERSLAELNAEYEAERARLLSERQAAVALRPGDASLVRAPSPGIVSFSLDGLEGELAPGVGLDGLFERMRRSERKVQDGSIVRQGDPLFRVVETSVVEVAVRLKGLALERGSRVILDFRGIPERSFTGSLVESVSVGSEFFGRVRLDAFDPSLILRREVDVTLTTERRQGVVVPASAVVEVDGRQGVYVALGERDVFRPVRVLGQDAKRAVVDGVPVGAAVIVNPKRLARR